MIFLEVVSVRPEKGKVVLVNKRIRKKKEKKSIIEYSFELVPDYPRKRRKKIVNEIWRDYHKNAIKIMIDYKRRLV